MIKFVRHIPSYIDISEPPPVQEFDSLDDLLSSLKTNAGKGRTFSHWARSFPNMVLGVWDDSNGKGAYWWVMGRTDADLSSLPEWSAPK